MRIDVINLDLGIDLLSHIIRFPLFQSQSGLWN